jgi:hypothetical protein
MRYTEEQFSRLPKWAQNRIKSLEQTVSDLEKRIAQYDGTEETNTYYVDLLEERPLPKNAPVKFASSYHSSVCVYISNDGHINVNGDSISGKTMVIMPRTANAFYIDFI